MIQNNYPYYEEYCHAPSSDALKDLFYVRSIGYCRCGEDFKVKRNKFADYHLIYTLSGKGYLEINKTVYISEKNTALLFSTATPHCYYTSKNDLWEHCYVFFGGRTVPFLFNKIIEKTGYLINLENIDYHFERFSILLEQLKNNDKLSEIRHSCLLDQLLTDICCQHNKLKEQLPPFILEAIKIIETHFNTRDINSSGIALKLKVNRSYFSRTFKKFTGNSPTDYINKMRLSNATDLLMNSNMNIKEIAYFTGFASEKSFIEYFKLQEGTTPSKYRKNNSNDNRKSKTVCTRERTDF